MPETTIIYGPPSPAPRPVPTQVVSLRARWADPWQPEPYLWAEQLAWHAAPAESTAQLTYRYGVGMQQGQTAFQTQFRLSKPRYFVKVTINDPDVLAFLDEPLVWYGILELAGDRLDGTRFQILPGGGAVGIASGRQTLVCYGLERLLDMHTVRTSTWVDVDTANEVTAARAITFNPEHSWKTIRHQRPKNRTFGKNGGSYAFAGAEDPLNNNYWSTHDIVEYLLDKQSPRDWDGKQRIKFALASDAEDVLPKWDQPHLKAHGVRLRHLLNTLMPRERLLSYRLDVDAENTIVLQPFTFASADVTIGSDATAKIKANPSQKILVFDRDSAAENVVLKNSTLDQVDQAVIQGARRRSCFSVSYVDATLLAGWPLALQTEYNLGATTAGDYPALTEVDECEKRMEEARSVDRLSTVYSRFVLPANWDAKASDGRGGFKRPVFPDDADSTKATRVYPAELHLLRTLPLLEGHNYDSLIVPNNVPTFSAGPYEELPPLVVTPLPEAPTRYVQIEKVGTEDDSESAETDLTLKNWSGSVTIPQHDRSIIVKTHGEMQHVLAKYEWAPADANDYPINLFDWRKLICTVAVEDDRPVEAKYPDPPSATVDALRTIVIDVGDVCRLDYLLPDTVIRVDGTTGALVRAGGGYIRDDREQLKRMAKFVYQWYSQTRSALEFTTSEVKPDLWLGDLVTKIGDQSVEGGHRQDVFSVVTSINLTLPVATGGASPPAPRMHFITQFGELDPLRF